MSCCGKQNTLKQQQSEGTDELKTVRIRKHHRNSEKHERTANLLFTQLNRTIPLCKVYFNFSV